MGVSPLAVWHRQTKTASSSGMQPSEAVHASGYSQMILNLNKQVKTGEKPISQEEALEIIRRIEQKYGTFASLKPSDRKPLRIIDRRHKGTDTMEEWVEKIRSGQQ